MYCKNNVAEARDHHEFKHVGHGGSGDHAFSSVTMYHRCTTYHLKLLNYNQIQEINFVFLRRASQVSFTLFIAVVEGPLFFVEMAESVPKQFHPAKSFSFPKRTFGSRERSFRSEWCQEFKWLHYDVVADAAFCHVCMCAEGEKRFLASTKRDAAFISRGFTYWRDAIVSFRTHAASACHKEAVQSDQLPKEMSDVAERLVADHTADKERNRSMFMRILQKHPFPCSPRLGSTWFWRW